MPCKTDLSVKPEVTPFFDPATNTISYVVQHPGSNACAVVDFVMDIDYAAGRRIASASPPTVSGRK